jgi:serine/threonine-protein kinase
VHQGNGDFPAARLDVAQAISRLQAPEHAKHLREARVLAKELGAS